MYEEDVQRNVRALLPFIGLLAATVTLFSVIFHLIMLYEGQQHSWLTGFYWAFTVMSTLGFGDITFHSDLGRVFSIVVLITGIVLLLIVLPFAFIRFFYAPWLEAQIRLRAPREIDEDVRDHVIICKYDEIARALIHELRTEGIPHFVIEPDATAAAALHDDGVSVVMGAADMAGTYEALRVSDARLVIANVSDVVNTNIVLTIREVAPDVPTAAFANNVDSIDVLELAGADHVLPLKQLLGQHLASRVNVGEWQAYSIGHFDELVIAEFPIEGTALPGRSVRDTRLRELTGVNIVAVWERGHLLHAGPDTVLSDHSVLMVVGTDEQILELNALFVIYSANDNPALVIGGGNVGAAAAEALRARGSKVHVLDSDPLLAPKLERIADRVIVGDASNLETVMEAGLADAPSVFLTTNDDATNIFLAIYCRKLNPTTHIVSRVTHDRNLESIHVAGADFALGHAQLAAKRLMSIIENREIVIVGEGTELFSELVTGDLVGKTLGESNIGSKTGLNVIALRHDGASTVNPPAEAELASGSELVMIGTPEQHAGFLKHFG